MQEYVIELSKYFIAFFMVLYTASCFYTFRYPVGEKHRGVFILQDLLMFLVQVLCFLNLSLVSGDFQYLFFQTCWRRTAFHAVCGRQVHRG